jgi:hypothetical protein
MNASSINLGERPLGLKAIEAALNGPVSAVMHPQSVARCEAAHKVLRRAAAGEVCLH